MESIGVFDGAGPGDSGPCPICGEEMKEKVYTSTPCLGPFPRPVHQVSGRYWHMVHEHRIWEHYKQRRDLYFEVPVEDTNLPD